MSERKTQAVFFDLDGTLTGFSDEVYGEVLSRVCDELARQYGIDAAKLGALHREMSVAHWRNVSAGVFTAKNGSRDGQQIMLDIWVDALEAAGCSDEAAAHIGHDAYWAARKGIFTIYDDAQPVLEQLHGLLPLVVITNGPADLQEDKLRILGINRYFDLIVSSGAHGIGKPDPAIFQVALDHLQVEPAAAWHVGDNLYADIGGARNAGLKAAWINRTGHVLTPEEPMPDAEMTSLRELSAFLEL
jgi:putative hydrolase of the HAD superfamily